MSSKPPTEPADCRACGAKRPSDCQRTTNVPPDDCLLRVATPPMSTPGRQLYEDMLTEIKALRAIAARHRPDAKPPADGCWAYLCGWAEVANPHPAESDAAKRWADNWAFQDRVAKVKAQRT